MRCLIYFWMGVKLSWLAISHLLKKLFNKVYMLQPASVNIFELHTYYDISPEEQHWTAYSLSATYLKFSLTEEIPVGFCRIMFFFSKVRYPLVQIFCLFTKLQGNELLLITLFSYQLVLFLQRVWEEGSRKACWKAVVLLLHLFKLGLGLTGLLWNGGAVMLWKARKKRKQLLACGEKAAAKLHFVSLSLFILKSVRLCLKSSFYRKKNPHPYIFLLMSLPFPYQPISKNSVFSPSI